MTPAKTVADYAAIAVAPLLIFLMISSLANFLMLMLYHGAFPQRVSWTLLMFTLGAVGIARVAIERDRAYALGYAGILGFLAFVAMLRFVDSPIFSAFILAVIAYLADVIVRDCTLIDDKIDASGQGLMDSGRMFLKKQIRPEDPEDDEHAATSQSPRGKTHQPGRTVMYLALAALPLFGLGQFFLRNDPGTWARAQWLLAVYLFSALSLLVTTSFLGLRRYLRQRRVEMPSDVSIGWLAGGLALIAVVLLVAYLAPLPGQALASFELPEFLDSPGGTEASQAGWGDEGADKSDPDAPKTTDDPNANRKEEQGQSPQQGAPPGEVSDGSREDGPAGSQDGGNQSGGQSESSPQQSEQSGSQESNRGSQNENAPSQERPNQGGGQESSGQQEKTAGQQDRPSGQSDDPQSGGDQTSQRPEEASGNQSPNDSSGQRSDQSESNGSQDPSSQSQQQSGDDADQGDEAQQGDDAQRSRQGERADQEDSSVPTQQPEESQSGEQSQNPDGLPAEGSPSSQSSSSPGIMQSVADTVPALAMLIKFLIFLVLAGCVGAFLWMNRHLITAWWNRLLGDSSEAVEDSESFLETETQVPQRSFASYRNPIGRESDLRRIIVITFQAFEAWTREQGTPRGKDETPAEFIRRVAASVPEMSAPASRVVNAYNRIAYGRGTAAQSDLDAADKLWRMMQSRRVVTTPPVVPDSPKPSATT